MTVRSRETVDELYCAICLELPEDRVVQCKAGHCFCESCIDKLGDNKRCPTCRTLMPEEHCRNQAIERVIAALPAECPTCKGQMSRGELRLHLCPQRPVQCSAPTCQWKGTFVELAAHEQACMHCVVAIAIKPLQEENAKLQEQNARLQEDNAQLRKRLKRVECRLHDATMDEIINLCRMLSMPEHQLASVIVQLRNQSQEQHLSYLRRLRDFARSGR